jgi:Bacteriophage baseplate protein W
MQIAFPFSVDVRGRVRQSPEAEHVSALIEQVLFTAPGERVNRPTFGSGLRQLVFGAASEEVAAAVRHLVQGALQQHLGDRIALDAVTIRAEDATLHVTVSYTLRGSQQPQRVELAYGL